MAQLIPDTFKQLDVPLPPDLERTFGYEGNERFVAFYWERGGDEFRVHDSRIDHDGQWHAWLTYSRHTAVYKLLHPFNFGNSDEAAEYWFIFDRAENKAYAAPAREAYDFFMPLPTPDNPAPVLTVEDWGKFARELERRVHERINAVTVDQINQRIFAQHNREHAMSQWLDAQLTKGAS